MTPVSFSWVIIIFVYICFSFVLFVLVVAATRQVGAVRVM